ncbi:HlyD family type I secretion periplasmic adaptor subunit [Ramlibacter sp.]|uniref:HlyD family type I secretion periplasmic adaptor subunit n=1 Tax=Ramlibacter sp. TaxID=1917967 RepID=UPI002B7F9636|nr:HlyD family type I secretion periplasmic adaptor subunit [Ramlibacter sp.]HWI84498.1 HlyD family type I secretion periplasmic adaptor subunit [Ramlibacter sp.]
MTKPELLQRLSSRHLAPVPAADLAPESDLPAVADTTRATRIGVWALLIGLGGFMLWAAFAPLDEGVPSQGVVAINTKRKTVQHPSGGIVKEVFVGEGDRVKEGQVLIKLDEATARANYETVRQHYLSLRANQGRLIAEQSGAATITFHPELQAASKDPLIRSQMLTQEQLFLSRRSALRADVQGLQESIEGQQALARSYESMLGNRRTQMSLLNEELSHTRELVKEGYAPRNRQLELERNASEASASVSELLGNITRAQRSIAELRQRIISRQQDYRKEVESQLSDVSREVLADEAKFRALSDDLGRIDIKSPATGQVVGLAVQTVGGVVAAGQKLMDIVPDNELLMIETKVAPNLIDRVHAGLPVDIRFTSFANSPQLVVEGKVVSVSGDLLTEQNGAAYFLSRVSVTPEGYKQLGKRQLQPGMPVEVVLKTGERTLLTYLLHPLTKRLAASLKEE